MPVMNGYETMAAIRQRPRSPSCRSSPSPARSSASERERCIAAGASDYIPKPVDTAELLAALADWFPPRRAGTHRVSAV